jgi:hypothetical protein
MSGIFSPPTIIIACGKLRDQRRGPLTAEFLAASGPFEAQRGSSFNYH